MTTGPASTTLPFWIVDWCPMSPWARCHEVVEVEAHLRSVEEEEVAHQLRLLRCGRCAVGDGWEELRDGRLLFDREVEREGDRDHHRAAPARSAGHAR